MYCKLHSYFAICVLFEIQNVYLKGTSEILLLIELSNKVKLVEAEFQIMLR